VAPPILVYLEDLVQMRKPHPCGGDTWRVVRVGADIGLRCQTCGRRVLLPRATFERRLKRFLDRGTSPAETDPPAGNQA
jgi:hypothetical protein